MSALDAETMLMIVDMDPRLPVGLSECYRYGLAGLCGPQCPACVMPAWGAGEDCGDWLNDNTEPEEVTA
jgi:hypothetical protein